MAALIQKRVLATLRSRNPPLIIRGFVSDALATTEIKPGEVGIVSGIPDQHLSRRVIIYSPGRTATQQGSGKVGKWKINFVSTQKWENPLMGWTSTGDPYANVGEAGLYFKSKEAAQSFAEKHGWDYVVKDPHTPLLRQVEEMISGQSWAWKSRHRRQQKPKAYADNFKWKGPPVSED